MLRFTLLVLSYAVVLGAGFAQVSPSRESESVRSVDSEVTPCPPQLTTLPAQLITYGDSVQFDLTQVARASTVERASTGSWTSLRVDRKTQRYSTKLSAADEAVAVLGALGAGLVEVCVTLSPVAGDLDRLDLVAPSGKTLQLLKGKIRKPRTARQVCFSPLVNYSFAQVGWIDRWDDTPIDWPTLAGESVAGEWTLIGTAAYGTTNPVQISEWSLVLAARRVETIVPDRDSVVLLATNRYAALPNSSDAYRFDISDEDGCVRSYVFPVNVQSNCGFNVRLASTGEPRCPGAADGEFSFIAVGAAEAPIYTLAGRSNTSGYFGSIASGTYRLTVRGADGCLLEKTFGMPQASVARVNVEQMAASCSPARYDVMVSSVGATEVVSAVWESTGVEALGKLARLEPGLHTLLYEDDRGCKYTDTLDLAPAGEVVVEVLAKAPACATDGNASIVLSASGGIGPYDAIWDDMASGLSREYLFPGTYAGVAYDSRGCETRFKTEIEAPTPLLVRHELLPPQCPGDRNGILSVSGTGGMLPYLLSIDGGEFREALSIDTLSSGLHSFTLRDGGGCEISQVVTVPVRGVLAAEADGGAGVKVYDGVPGEATPVDLEASVAQRSAARWQESLRIGTTALCDTCGALTSLEIAVDSTLSRADSLKCVAELTGDGGGGGPRPQVRVPEVFHKGTALSSGAVLRVFGRSGTVIDRFAVYDLAGVLVFEARDFEIDAPRGWNGKVKGALAPAGAYLYEVEATLPSGATDRARGTTTLVR